MEFSLHPLYKGKQPSVSGQGWWSLTAIGSYCRQRTDYGSYFIPCHESFWERGVGRTTFAKKGSPHSPISKSSGQAPPRPCPLTDSCFTKTPSCHPERSKAESNSKSDAEPSGGASGSTRERINLFAPVDRTHKNRAKIRYNCRLISLAKHSSI